MNELLRDIRYAVRRLFSQPAFSVIVIATLALGIGATTAIFSMVQTVLLRPLPYPGADRLVTTFHFYPTLNNLEAGYAVPTYRDLGQRTHLFEQYAVLTGGDVTLTGAGGPPERLDGITATARYFDVYGVRAEIGRTFAAGEDQAGHDKVVVLSHDLWVRRFGQRADVLGRKLTLDGEPYEVIGVMPATFRDISHRATEVWIPLAFKPEQFSDDRRTNEFLQMIGRLRPGISIDQASREMTAFAAQLKRDYPSQYPPSWTIKTRALADVGRERLRPALLVLLGAVGLVLLIACANLANLLLARATARARELAIRTAIGASRIRLMMQLLTESVVLSIAGGALGILLAYWIVRAVVALTAPTLPWIEDVRLDLPVLIFALVISLGTGFLFGVLPAVYASQADLHTGLREGGRSGADSPRGQLARRGLVVLEMALALTLLVGAGLLIRSFDRLLQVSPGFDPRQVVTFRVALPATRYTTPESQTAYWDALLARLASTGSVDSAGASSVLPFSGSWSTGSFSVEGYQPPKGQPGPWGDIRIVSPSYWRTMRIQLLRGRLLDDRDRGGARQVAVVDDETVRRYWPNEDPIGKRITFEDAASPTAKWIEVVGVVAHTAHEGLDAERRVQIYGSYRQFAQDSLSIAVRTTGDPQASVNELRRTVLSVDRDVPLFDVKTMEEMMASAVGQRRLSMVLLGSFASLALLLAALGIYGVISYDVTRRTQELGLRMALGADRHSVLALVMRQGLVLAALGVAIGLCGAAAGARLIESQLFGIHTIDPVTFVGVAGLLTAVAVLATLVPALRATRVDPMHALRYE